MVKLWRSRGCWQMTVLDFHFQPSQNAFRFTKLSRKTHHRHQRIIHALEHQLSVSSVQFSKIGDERQFVFSALTHHAEIVIVHRSNIAFSVRPVQMLAPAPAWEKNNLLTTSGERILPLQPVANLVYPTLLHTNHQDNRPGAMAAC